MMSLWKINAVCTDTGKGYAIEVDEPSLHDALTEAAYLYNAMKNLRRKQDSQLTDPLWVSAPPKEAM